MGRLIEGIREAAEKRRANQVATDLERISGTATRCLRDLCLILEIGLALDGVSPEQVSLMEAAIEAADRLNESFLLEEEAVSELMESETPIAEPEIVPLDAEVQEEGD